MSCHDTAVAAINTRSEEVSAVANGVGKVPWDKNDERTDSLRVQGAICMHFGRK